MTEARIKERPWRVLTPSGRVTNYGSRVSAESAAMEYSRESGKPVHLWHCEGKRGAYVADYSLAFTAKVAPERTGRRRKMITCLDCEREQPHKGRGLCAACWTRRYKTGRLEGRPGLIRTRQQVVTDVQRLGAAPATEIAQRMGLAPASIARALYRAGRGDLARPFTREVNRKRSKQAA